MADATTNWHGLQEDSFASPLDRVGAFMEPLPRCEELQEKLDEDGYLLEDTFGLRKPCKTSDLLRGVRGVERKQQQEGMTRLV